MRKFLYGLVTLLLFVFVSLLIYNEVVKAGLNFRAQSEYLEYTFYAISAVLFYALILRPVLLVFFAPHYSVAEYCGQKERVPHREMRKRGKRLLKQGRLPEEDVTALNEALDSKKSNKKEVLGHRLNIIYSHRMKKNIDKLTLDTARDVFCLTAVSQNSFFDFLSVLVNNLRMIKRIVIMCGFRPTFIRMCKVYINVIASAFIADGAQRIDFAALVKSSLGGTMRMLVNSAMDGAVNAFFVIRVGMLTKQYLYSEDLKREKPALRTTALGEAATHFPSFLTSLITSPIKGIASLFVPVERKEEEGDGEGALETIVEGAEWKWRGKK